MKNVTKLAFAFIFLLSMIIAGCTNNESANTNNEEELVSNGDENKQDISEVDVSQIKEFKQSPMLNDKGLPDVKERLPLEPKLPNEMPAKFLQFEIGKYGGELNTVTRDPKWDADLFVMSNEPLLNTPGILGEEVTGNVLKDYEVTEDQKEFTFYMREGLKWSDGEPVTTEDVRFAVEDVLLNEEIMPIVPSWLHSGGNAQGNPLKLEVVDEYTYKISFDEPYGGFPIALAIGNWRGYNDLLKPAHYLKQFHKKYADAAELEKLIKEAKLGEDTESTWVNFFNYMDITEREMSHSNAVGFPSLYPWTMKEMDKTYAIYERNPYYFKVDPEGNQLPYIDSIKSTIVQDTEVVGLKTIAGEVDFSRETTALTKMPVYRENAEKGGYEALLANMHVTPSDVFLNQTYNDPVWREVVQDIRFRQALNFAIDREEIIDSLYFGFAEPSEITDSKLDLDKANQLLDEMGMKKGTDGYRIGPDGKRFSIPFEVQAAAPDIVPLAELLVEMWKEIGIHAAVKTIDGTLWGTRNTANELKASIMWTHTPLYYMSDYGETFWGPLWDSWWQSGGETGEEPPEHVKKFFTLMDELQVSTPEEAKAVEEKIREEMKNNLHYFVHVEKVKQPLIVNNKLGNITDKGTAISINFAGEQMYFKE
ncbi:ABC transporter substrate-binding protein [Metabacillus sp. FJAT-53654]|uniref:ABC transporter substrate-binding protein n=1 Tax=Metabacillus rhizosphaerae TaxID=3117747 RepID=A0ABZ2MW85_9BACI